MLFTIAVILLILWAARLLRLPRRRRAHSPAARHRAHRHRLSSDDGTTAGRLSSTSVSAEGRPRTRDRPSFVAVGDVVPATASRVATLARHVLRSLEFYVVAHTHWDREWYHAADRFRQRLVALIDELLDDPPAARRELPARRPGDRARRLSRRAPRARRRAVARCCATGGSRPVRGTCSPTS